MAVTARWSMFRTLAAAVRVAVRPGSPGMGERLSSVPRLVRATLSGRYTGTTRGRLLMIAAAAAYVVSPIDLIPEAAFLMLGMVDDAFVVSWIAAALVTETESFLDWERSSSGWARPEERGSSTHAAGETVQGHVVR